jgi:hypothetical protein
VDATGGFVKQGYSVQKQWFAAWSYYLPGLAMAQLRAKWFANQDNFQGSFQITVPFLINVNLKHHCL